MIGNINGLLTNSGGGSSYSTSETLTGDTWINGKPIYRKVIDFGRLPQSGDKNVAMGITGLSQITKLYAIFKITSGSDVGYCPVPYIMSQQIYNVRLTTLNDNVTIGVFDDIWYNIYQATAYVIVEYTKS